MTLNPSRFSMSSRITSMPRTSPLSMNFNSLVAYAGDTALDKKTFTALIKKYVKQVRGYLKENNPEREKAFVEEMNTYIAGVLKAFNEYDFYHGTVDYDAVVCLFFRNVMLVLGGGS